MIRAAILAAALLPSMAMAQLTSEPFDSAVGAPDGRVISKRINCTQWVKDILHCTLDPKQVVIDNINDFIKPEISGENDESKLTCVGIDGSDFRICKPSNCK